MEKEFMSQGDKLLALKDDLYNTVCNRFAVFQLDVSTGIILLDAIKADLQSMALNTILRRGDGIINELKAEVNKHDDVSSDQAD